MGKLLMPRFVATVCRLCEYIICDGFYVCIIMCMSACFKWEYIFKQGHTNFSAQF